MTAKYIIDRFKKDYERIRYHTTPLVSISELRFGQIGDKFLLVILNDLGLNDGKLEKQNERIEEIIESLTHYSYHISKGELILFDIRPILITADSLLITEPIIYSKIPNRFSSSNLGLKGIENFKNEHKCNRICVDMSLPKIINDSQKL